MNPRRPLFLLAFVTHCGATTPPPPFVGESSKVEERPEAANLRMDRLEAKLLAAESIVVSFHTTVSGSLNGSFTGTVIIRRPNRVHLEGNGTIGGKPAHVLLIGEPVVRGVEPGVHGGGGRGHAIGHAHEPDDGDAGAALFGGSDVHQFTMPFSPTTYASTITILARVGVSKALVRLSGGIAPEWLQGDARQALPLKDVSNLSVQDETGLAFTVLLGSQTTADEKLWIDPGTGLPSKRVMTVRGADGTMDVVEVYDEFAVDSP
jgi:hypothetical protein